MMPHNWVAELVSKMIARENPKRMRGRGAVTLDILVQEKHYPLIILFSSFVLLVLPLLAGFSHFYYGDDITILETVTHKGFAGSLKNWIDNYGLAYRPLATIIQYILYLSLGSFPDFFYFFELATFYVVVVAYYFTINAVTSDKKLSIFTSLFFLFFPLNAATYLQLSSFGMYVNLLIICLVIYLLSKINNSKNKKIISLVVILLWTVTIFIYEQTLGFIMFCPVYYFAMRGEKYNKNIYLSIILAAALITSLYIFINVSSGGNPKLSTLMTTNYMSTTYQYFILLYYKISRTIYFFIFSVKDGFVWVSFQNIYIKSIYTISMCISFFCIIKILKLNSPVFSPKTTFSLSIMWIILSILPFFLYVPFRIPPYCFTTPSIGIGALIFSVAYFNSCIFNQVRIFFLSFVFGVVFCSFVLGQYGYRKGFKEEFDYWNKIYAVLEEHIDFIPPKTKIILLGLPLKNNDYIFWLTRATGTHYFERLMHGKGITVETELLFTNNGAVFADSASPEQIDLKTAMGYKWNEGRFLPVSEIIVGGQKYNLKWASDSGMKPWSVSWVYDKYLQRDIQLPEWLKQRNTINL